MFKLPKRLTSPIRDVIFEADILWSKLNAEGRTADLSIFHDFAPPPGGGGHQFLRALRNEVESRGLRTENNSISRSTRACLMNSFNFNAKRLQRLLRRDVLCIHRVDGPVDVYRGRDEGVDRRIWRINQELADKTIFQSRYSLEKHRELGLEFRQPVVILNAADPRIFHPEGRSAFSDQRKIKLITTSWSDNTNKGADVYKWLDEHLDWDRMEFTFLGRSPISFKNIQILAPVDSIGVAELLRRHDIYITASQNESCSNSLIEALSCGLPAIYLKSGGNSEIVGKAGVGFDSDEEIPAMIDRLTIEYESRQGLIANPSLAEVTTAYLTVMELL